MMNKLKITTLFIFLIIMVAGVMVNNASAKTYKWPIVSGVDIQQGGGNKTTYVISMGYDILPESSATNEKISECVPNCILRFAFRKVDIATGANTSFLFIFPEVASGWSSITWKDLLVATSKLTTTTVTKDVFTGSEGLQCVDIGLIPVTYRDAAWSTWLSTRVAPPGVTQRCFGFPPLNQWCALTTPSVTYDFGNVRVQNAVGSHLKTTVNVECTMGMKYVLKIKGLDHMQLDNGMTAKFTANGKDLGEPLDSKVGQFNSVELEATLQGTPPAEGGYFSGTSVLAVSYP